MTGRLCPQRLFVETSKIDQLGQRDASQMIPQVRAPEKLRQVLRPDEVARQIGRPFCAPYQLRVSSKP
jgi:hypothetical protein